MFIPHTVLSRPHRSPYGLGKPAVLGHKDGKRLLVLLFFPLMMSPRGSKLLLPIGTDELHVADPQCRASS